jgi:polysaccharide export outer membrane protein
MNLVFPRYRKQSNRSLGALAVFAVFCTALGYPQAARAQTDASSSGSQPATLPAVSAPESEHRAQNLPNAEPPKVAAVTPDPKVEATKVDAPKDVPAGGAKAAAPSIGGKSYVIGPNDVLGVSVWNQPQISKMVDVHLDGMISLPLVGEVKADGLTAIQLKEELTRRLGEVLTEPNVDVSVLKINSKHYSVYGSVMRGGTVVLAERTRIMDALSQAVIKDGFAKTNKIELRRGKEKFLFNQKDYLKGKNMDKNVNRELQDGDEIIVPE